MTSPTPTPTDGSELPALVTPRSLTSGNVVSVPDQRDEHGNPTSYASKALMFVDDEYEDEQAHKPYSVLYFEDGTTFTDWYPEIPKWNVLDPGVPFEAVYDKIKGDGSGGQLKAYRRTDGHGADVPLPERKRRERDPKPVPDKDPKPVRG
jgi:hypothetical protein